MKTNFFSSVRLVKVAFMRFVALFPLVLINVLLLGSHSAFATLITAYVSGNDCAGYFNDYSGTYEGTTYNGTNGFDACQIFYGTGNDLVLISPVIAKFDGSLSDPTISVSNQFSSVDGTEWTFSDSNLDGDLDTWVYIRGDDDPAIRYWSAKAGNGFNLFWVDNIGSCDSANYVGMEGISLDCLNAADFMDSGMWETPDSRDLSHIVFYDSKDAVIVPPSEQIIEIPEPNILLLMATGLIFIRLSGRRKTKGTLSLGHN
ncbi:hypothetical protein [Vibrio ziniensis]|uniref:Ice-binding protein C-terminal domain-containing protein n=1 Tax=Vibrio ziniensis TaxID=2711221 RepID=A0A6G7CN74_9VIBR|nr:hypothetical protein [Vibrio ziniensis]QIH43559.1 hypothetical protein G5S32_16320 [Vibrio ziniensis]